MRKIHVIPILAILVLVTSLIPGVYAVGQLKLDPTSGPIDSSVKISDDGFTPGAPLYIFFGDLRKDTVTASSTGSISIDIPVPHGATIGTTYTICISDDSSSCDNLASADFTVITGSPSIPEFPFSFSLVIIFVAVAAMYIVIRQKMTTSFFKPF